MTKIKNREKTLNYIKDYFKTHGYCPSYMDIMEGTGIKSKSTVHVHVKDLMKLGELETDEALRGEPRAFRVKGMKVSFCE